MNISKGVPCKPVSILLGNGFSIGISDKFGYEHIMFKMVALLLPSLTENQIKQISKSDDHPRMIRQLLKDFGVKEKLRQRFLEYIHKHFKEWKSVCSYEEILGAFSYKELEKILIEKYKRDERSSKNSTKGEEYREVIVKVMNQRFINSIFESYKECYQESTFDNKISHWKDCLGRYHQVFTTNYDNLVYDVAGERACYLHGPAGRGVYVGNSWQTCIVEPTKEAKLAKIVNNEDLQARWNSFKAIEGTLVVYGHSLSAVDGHLVDAIIENTKLKHIYLYYYNDKDKDNFASLSVQIKQKNLECVVDLCSSKD